MTKNEFLKFVNNYLDSTQSRLFAEVVLLESVDLESILIDFSCQKFKNFESLFACFKKELLKNARNRAKKTHIKNYRGTRLEEENLLTTYYLKKSLENSPKWFVERIL